MNDEYLDELFYQLKNNTSIDIDVFINLKKLVSNTLGELNEEDFLNLKLSEFDKWINSYIVNFCKIKEGVHNASKLLELHITKEEICQCENTKDSITIFDTSHIDQISIIDLLVEAKLVKSIDVARFQIAKGTLTANNKRVCRDCIYINEDFDGDGITLKLNKTGICKAINVEMEE